MGLRRQDLQVDTEHHDLDKVDVQVSPPSYGCVSKMLMVTPEAFSYFSRFDYPGINIHYHDIKRAVPD